MGLREKLEELRKQGIQEIKASADLDHLNDIRVKMLGKKGPLTTVLRGMKDLSKEERPKVGKFANEIRDELAQALEAKKAELATARLNAKLAAPEMEKVKSEIQSKAKEVMAAQKELEKTIEPELVQKYKKAKEVAKFPPLVPFDEATNSCMGCGLELSKDIAAKLRQDGGLEFCPNCNRLVYKK